LRVRARLPGPASRCARVAGVTLLSAAVVNAMLDLWQVAGSDSELTSHTLLGAPLLFLLGTVVVWLCVVVVVAVLGRLWLGVGLVAASALLIGYAGFRKEQLLREPLYPGDLTYAGDIGFLVDTVGAGPVLALLAGSALLVLGGFWAGRRLHTPRMRPADRGDRWRRVAVRLTAAGASAAALGYVLQFHQPGNLARVAYENLGAHWRSWHQSANYTDNGFVAGLLYNLPVPAMAAPPGYGPATMRRLVARYAEAAARVNRTRDSDALADVNVVFLLGETFTDPTRVDGVRLAQDPIPYTRALMRRTPSGQMWSPQYGGGTANVEFEALTGMSIGSFRPQLTTPYQMLVPGHDTFPSAARFLAGQGLRTLALHSFTSALYRRAEVYPALGFEQSVFVDEMTHTGRVARNAFVSDKATYAELLSRLHRCEDPLFANVVTMQNHYPTAGKYPDPIAVTGLEDGAATESLAHYARGLRHSDAALRFLVRALERSRERTVVVFYGDHLPPLWPEGMLTLREQHETPFLVYANFGRQPAEALPTTSPVHFVNHALETVGAPVSAYHALLLAVERHLPAMGQGVLITRDGTRVRVDDLSPAARRLLRDYRLVQYDLAVGRRHSAGALFDIPQ
jgi:phosphoglycerol transferase MdoB-like AlkP superfamily enzyme